MSAQSNKARLRGRQAGSSGSRTYKAKIATKRSIEVAENSKVLFPIGWVGDMIHEMSYSRLHRNPVFEEIGWESWDGSPGWDRARSNQGQLMRNDPVKKEEKVRVAIV